MHEEGLEFSTGELSHQKQNTNARGARSDNDHGGLACLDAGVLEFRAIARFLMIASEIGDASI